MYHGLNKCITIKLLGFVISMAGNEHIYCKPEAKDKGTTEDKTRGSTFDKRIRRFSSPIQFGFRILSALPVIRVFHET